jgi:hypothetical protein
MSHSEFISYCQQKFKSVKNPTELLSDVDFMRIFTQYYEKFFHEKPLIYKCGVCLYEYYREISDLTDQQVKNRLNMTHIIKENTILWGFDGRPYGRKSANINSEMLEYLLKKHPGAFDQINNDQPEKEMPIKKRRGTKKVSNGTDN